MSLSRFIVPEEDELSWIRTLLRGVFDIEDITTGLMNGHATRVRGHLLGDPDQVYDALAPVFRARGRTLLLREAAGQHVLLIIDRAPKLEKNKLLIPALLAVATVISVLITYLMFWEGFEGGPGLMAKLGRGIVFTVSLLSILLAHELGHYFVARRFGVAVTLPYLIPFPFSPFGTMGAVIRMKDIPPTRRAMLLIGAAGPLAGLLVDLPILLLGISLSEVSWLPPGGGYIMEGNSILYGLAKWLIHGIWLPSKGRDLFLHPIAFAGWAGLLVTSFNLIPAGQLDGGHIATALLGNKSRYLNWAIIACLVLLGFLWQGWFLWAMLIFFFSRAQVEPLNALSKLRPGDILLAIGLLVLFILTFTPLPMRFVV